MSSLLIITILLVTAPVRGKDRIVQDRIWLDVRINGNPAKLVFDSGATCSALTPKAVHRLGLKALPCSTNELPPNLALAMTEMLAVTIQGKTAHIRFAVLNVPQYARPDFEGLIGLGDLSGCILRVDADRSQVQFVESLPKQISEFSRLARVSNSRTLDLEIGNSLDTNRVLCIDTGSPTGVELPAAEWRRWKQSRPHTPSTLGTVFSASDGFCLFEESWADEIQFGPLKVTSVPIQTAGPGNLERYGLEYVATLGITALRQFDLIIDGPGGEAYMRPKNIDIQPYQHNRLGAIFVPTSGHANEGIARVIEGSPAYEAGIRNGDRLLQVDGVRVEGWTEDWRSKFTMPAGTKLKLRLERNYTNFITTAVLRDIVAAKPNRHD